MKNCEIKKYPELPDQYELREILNVQPIIEVIQRDREERIQNSSNKNQVTASAGHAISVCPVEVHILKDGCDCAIFIDSLLGHNLRCPADCRTV